MGCWADYYCINLMEVNEILEFQIKIFRMMSLGFSSFWKLNKVNNKDKRYNEMHSFISFCAFHSLAWFIPSIHPMNFSISKDLIEETTSKSNTAATMETLNDLRNSWIFFWSVTSQKDQPFIAHHCHSLKWPTLLFAWHNLGTTSYGLKRLYERRINFS